MVGSSPAPERNPVIVPDGEGGAIFVFEWENEEGATDVMAQRVKADGTLAWNNGERAIDLAATANNERAPTAVSDGRGGALVAFEVEFLEGEFKGDVDIMGQRISRDGVVMWNGGEEASTVASGKGIERKPVAVGDGMGGMIVAFEYEPLEGEFAGDIDVFAQRVDGDGNMLWEEGKKSVVVSSAPGLERAPSIVPLPNAQIIVAIEHEFRQGENAGDIDVLAQRLDAEGKVLWNEGETPTMVSGAKWLERAPIALPDGEGGAIVVFPAVGPEGDFEGDEDIEASRISGDGALVWNEGQRWVDIASSDLLERKPSAAVAK
ncbi:MAG: exo-alpha-sialidase [Armatimonadetes bacterium]|nr:exo-alpha-sialidase [Armatimonadota bacterium]